MNNKGTLLQFAFAQARAGHVAPEDLLVRVREENRTLKEPLEEEVINKVVADAMRHADLSEIFMDTPELATLTKVTPQAIRKQVASGRGCPSYKIGGRRLWRRSEVEKWLESQRTEGR